MSACGVSNSAEVVAAFEIARGKDIWQFLPAMAQAPGLENDTGRAFVIVYGPLIEPPGAAGGIGMSPPDRLPNAVCVVQADGDATLHYNVSRAGLRTP